MKEKFEVKISETMLDSFRNITGDVNPLHNDISYAKSSGFDKRVAFGMLTASFLSTLAGVYLPGKYSYIQEVTTKFVKPVFPGDLLEVIGEVIELDDCVQRFVMKVEIKNQEGNKVLRGQMKVGVINAGK
ncbi:MaoC/PaaZ C-terminal domain-containing protein [Butyrivibrio hungatei]|nr:MaoC/PaaZ C-terminal domain-containing protein [Butyrivibrio hungatei]